MGCVWSGSVVKWRWVYEQEGINIPLRRMWVGNSAG